MRISVIVTTYNWPHALEHVILSLLSQTIRNFEIIIADDGSAEDTADLIRKFQRTSNIPIIHAWQEDEGFRVASARNKAVLLAEGDYLIFLDGDCCTSPDFLHNHQKIAEPGFFVAGKRSFIKPWCSGRFLANGWPFYLMPKPVFIFLGIFLQLNRIMQFLPIPMRNSWRKPDHSDYHKVQTCNLGAWKSDFFMVGGFDEEYRGHGLEDSDFVVRLIKHDIRRKNGHFVSPVLHLFHPRLENSKNRAEALSNWKIFNDLLNSDRKLPLKGIRRMPLE